MVRSLNLLAETTIRAKDMKPGRYSDGGGLYLMVKKGGTKSWTFVHFKGSGAGRVWKEAGLGSYQAMPDGSIRSNMTVKEAVDAMVARRRRAGR